MDIINKPIYVGITGVGMCHGEEFIDNELISGMISAAVELKLKRADGSGLVNKIQKENLLTNSQWIFERTGIQSRYYTSGSPSSMALKAAKEAMACTPRKTTEYDFILFATVNPDYRYSPPTASLLHHKLALEVRDGLGLKNSLTTDISNACTSFGSALAIGYSLIKSGMAKCGLVIGSDKMSTTVDRADRAFSILLGDAAGAFVLEAVGESYDSFPYGTTGFVIGTDPIGALNIIAPAGGAAKPLTLEALFEAESNPQIIRPDMLLQDGKKVFKDIINLLIDEKELTPNTVLGKLIADSGLSLSEFKLAFFHQANLRINQYIEKRMRRFGFSGLVYNTIAEVGNTTSAAVPYAVAHAWENGLLAPGALVLLAAFGGGYTWCAVPIRWTLNIPCPI